MPGQAEPIPNPESRAERWVRRVGRRARGRSTPVAIAVLAAASGGMLLLASVQRDSHALLVAVVMLASGVLLFERRVFDRIVRRQAEEIARLRGGGGD